jgi:hypothetical protein
VGLLGIYWSSRVFRAIASAQIGQWRLDTTSILAWLAVGIPICADYIGEWRQESENESDQPRAPPTPGLACITLIS